MKNQSTIKQLISQIEKQQGVKIQQLCYDRKDGTIALRFDGVEYFEDSGEFTHKSKTRTLMERLSHEMWTIIGKRR